MNDHYKLVKKSDLENIKEFFISLGVVSDSKALIDSGKYYQIVAIYGRLRILLTDKTTEPLLFVIASILQKELEIYCLAKQEAPTSEFDFNKGLELYVHSLNPNLEKTSDRHKKITMRKFLNETIVTYQGNNLSIKRIINELANKYGGAHSSKNTLKYLKDLSNYGLSNQPLLDNIIMQLSELTYSLGLKMLKSISDIKIYTTLYLTNNKAGGEVFLFDIKLPFDFNRLALILHDNNLKFLVVDTFGNTHLVNLKTDVIHETVLLLNVLVEITENFKTCIKLYIHEELVEECILDTPLLNINQMESYDFYINRGFNVENQDYEFGLADLTIKRGDDAFLAKMDLREVLACNENDIIPWFGKGEYGFFNSKNPKIILPSGHNMKRI